MDMGHGILNDGGSRSRVCDDAVGALLLGLSVFLPNGNGCPWWGK